MTKFYKSQRRGSHRGLYIAVILVAIFLLAAGGGYWLWQHRASKPDNKAVVLDENVTKYTSFSGGYVFSIPANYVIDETLVSGVLIAYPEGAPPKPGMSLEELYKKGAVAVQPIADLKDDNPKAFKEYINNKLAAQLGKETKSLVDVRQAKQGRVDALKIFALDKQGKRLKAMYAVNLTRPVLMVASEESNALKIMGSTLQEIKDTKARSEVDSATGTAKDLLQLIVLRNISALGLASVDSFDPTAFGNDLEASTAFLDRPVTILGASYKADSYVAQFVFNPKTKDQVPAGGVIALRKENGSWKLEAVQLPR